MLTCSAPPGFTAPTKSCPRPFRRLGNAVPLPQGNAVFYRLKAVKRKGSANEVATRAVSKHKQRQPRQRTLDHMGLPKFIYRSGCQTQWPHPGSCPCSCGCGNWGWYWFLDSLPLCRQHHRSTNRGRVRLASSPVCRPWPSHPCVTVLALPAPRF